MADLPIQTNGHRIGECIYCGATERLTREHAVPYGLNGPWTLHEARCHDCARVVVGSVLLEGACTVI